MKTEELIEDYLVYTDNGIEKVHWCNVNGVKELVSPKGKVYGYVPDYFEFKRLREQLKSANNAMKAMLPFAHNYPKERIEKYLKKWGAK